ncbi:arsenite methyltransferase [Nanobdella aerobiophila]|uniref:Arsenite methyltransferase n=1 Tax=Nanobdella aerobiophila TaxID=2586965 RepID=A0A915SKA9_9ARCH|nr:class I SAM-dependent methyltransferase [Nanobdella aerobiophila]BBL45533.1 arsenite methyltransferase [Nanobdella aerobiophila]
MIEDRRINPILLDNFIIKYIDNPKSIFKLVKSNMNVLDHGSGPGNYTLIFSKLAKDGTVYAIDSDPKQVDILNYKIKKYNIKNVKTFVSRDLSVIEDNSIDFLFSKDVLCCTTLHEELVMDIKRVLRPGGIAYVSIKNNFIKNDPRNISYKKLYSLFDNPKHKYNNLIGSWLFYRKPVI